MPSPSKIKPPRVGSEPEIFSSCLLLLHFGRFSLPFSIHGNNYLQNSGERREERERERDQLVSLFLTPIIICALYARPSSQKRWPQRLTSSKANPTHKTCLQFLKINITTHLQKNQQDRDWREREINRDGLSQWEAFFIRQQQMARFRCCNVDTILRRNWIFIRQHLADDQDLSQL